MLNSLIRLIFFGSNKLTKERREVVGLVRSWELKILLWERRQSLEIKIESEGLVSMILGYDSRK
jgi:hypothetical protein